MVDQRSNVAEFMQYILDIAMGRVLYQWLMGGGGGIVNPGEHHDLSHPKLSHICLVFISFELFTFVKIFLKHFKLIIRLSKLIAKL